MNGSLLENRRIRSALWAKLAVLTTFTSLACSHHQDSSRLAQFGMIALATKGRIDPKEVAGFDRTSAWEVFESPAKTMGKYADDARDGALVLLCQAVEAEDEARILRNIESGVLSPRIGGLMLAAALAHHPNASVESGIVPGLLNGTELEVATALSALPVLTGRLLEESIAAGVSLDGSGESPLTEVQTVFGKSSDALVEEWKQWLEVNGPRTTSELLHEFFRNWWAESESPTERLREPTTSNALFSLKANPWPEGVSIGDPEWPAVVETLLERDPPALIDVGGILVSHDWHR